MVAQIPGLERPVKFRSLTQEEHTNIEMARLNHNGTLNMAKVRETVARSIAMTVCNDEGLLEFSDADIPKIMQMDARTADAMMDVINANFVNRVSVDEMVKNSDGDPID